MDDIIRTLVKEAKAEQWEVVDAQIPTVAHNANYVSWAYRSALKSVNPNVRDLGVTIIQHAPTTLLPKDTNYRQRLYNRMIEDKNPYVRFRSAFALVAHGVGKYEAEVRKVLLEAKKDNDVKEIAEECLKKLAA